MIAGRIGKRVWFKHAAVELHERIGVDAVEHFLHAFRRGILTQKKAVVQPDGDFLPSGRGNPVNHAFHLAAFRTFSKRVEIDAAAKFRDSALRIPDQLIAANDISAAQAYFSARDEPFETGRGILAEVFPFDKDFTRQGNLAAAGFLALGVTRHLQPVDPLRVEIAQHDFQRAQYAHGAGSVPVQVLADGVLEHADIDQAFAAGDSRRLAEIADRSGRIAPPPHSGEGRHARVVPAVDLAFFHHRPQVALAHHGVADPQRGELGLLRQHVGEVRVAQVAGRAQGLDVELAQDPVVKRAMILEFQRA